MGKKYLIRSEINSEAKNIECKVKNWRHVPSAVVSVLNASELPADMVESAGGSVRALLFGTTLVSLVDAEEVGSGDVVSVYHSVGSLHHLQARVACSRQDPSVTLHTAFQYQ